VVLRQLKRKNLGMMLLIGNLAILRKDTSLKMEKLNIDLNTKANIIIDTIHQVKGGEAENVVLYAKTNWPSDFDGKKFRCKIK
jgi:hypothetical protein